MIRVEKEGLGRFDLIDAGSTLLLKVTHLIEVKLARRCSHFESYRNEAEREVRVLL